MKVLVLSFTGNVQYRLMFDHAIPNLSESGDGAGNVCLTDDYGQTIEFPMDEEPIIFRQDTEQLDRLEVAMMVRAKTNEIAAMQQLQSNPANMIVHPGRGLIS